LPQYLIAEQGGRLAGAVPLYLKSHSYGEYVFDWAWAEAYERAGLRYYPKLVAAVPFTPVTGPRFLVAPGFDADQVRETLARAALELARELKVSSLHWLFTTADDNRALAANRFIERRGSQFHWHNRSYRDFEEFLAGFTAPKRKKVKRERRFVQESGVRMEVREGRELDARDWTVFHEFYHQTIRKHGAIPYLNRAFFDAIARTMPERVVMVFARRDSDVVACALNLRSHDTLFGRYWGGDDSIHSLHFETCYYTPIEYCITHGLRRFEAGAQGAHKLARGLEPVVTTSMHWLAHPEFARAVEQYLARERDAVAESLLELNTRAPFKRTVESDERDRAIVRG
jgi:predicted N-acyltransferase